MGNPSARYIRLLSLLIALALAAAVTGWLLGRRMPQVSLGINTWTGYDPLILAEEKGLFEHHGVQVQLRRFESTGDEMKAMQEGHLDGAAFTLDEALSVAASGVPLKIVLLIDYSMGGDMIVGKPSIASIRDLENRRVGYEGTMVGEFLLKRALQRHSMRASDVTLVDVAAADWIEAFEGEAIDALVCFNPTAALLLERMGGNMIFSSREIPFEIIDVLVFDTGFFERHPNTVPKILLTWFDSLDYIERHLDESARIIAARKGISTDLYKRGLDGLVAPDLEENSRMLDLSSTNNVYKYSQRIIDFMLAKGLLNARPSTVELFEPSVIQGLARP
ncbi:ABC transporter substrate-binding protein [Imhoffiella purpurea]|uniref:ABC-type nitrate/sulfonate/bicarbonate transport system protein n=1 Tax=Imhoffiella purpurea TaxID=1249627 RepID=W9V1Z7_9GAMM|nr:ABC transporter substrate-binding protein [Imhoffiella purpurea]EXJ13518.1 ABC-type nitrate/sulfonate/bicarbonate transport system protein [Imhoffiella purpurea]